MTDKTDTYLKCCLYFTANELARKITRMAEQEFKLTGLSPSHAFLLMLVNEQPSITPGQLAKSMALKPSTVTRFIEALERQDLVKRTSEGRRVLVEATKNGAKLLPKIRKAWKSLYEAYSKVLGKKEGDKLTSLIHQAAEALD